MRTRRASFHGPTPVFECAVCGRRTRAVDSDTCCPECFELAGHDNYHNDNGIAPTAAELLIYEDLLKNAVGKGGDASAIRRNNSYIWHPDA